jgi:hypothetical protein
MSVDYITDEAEALYILKNIPRTAEMFALRVRAQRVVAMAVERRRLEQEEQQATR